MPLFNFAAEAFTDGSRLPGGYCRSYMTVKEEKWRSPRESSEASA
jgi:hypothetical protein